MKYLPNDYNTDDFKIEFSLPDYIDYKTKKDIGDIKFYFQDELLYTEKVLIKEEIKPNFLSIIRDNIIYICIGLLIIICSIIIIVLKKKKKGKEIPVI